MPITRPPREIRRLINEAAAEYGSLRRFAQQAGLNANTLGRVRNGHYPIGAEACLRIARTAGWNPSAVLRAAGKHSLVMLLEEAYGPPKVRTRPPAA